MDRQLRLCASVLPGPEHASRVADMEQPCAGLFRGCGAARQRLDSFLELGPPGAARLAARFDCVVYPGIELRQCAAFVSAPEFFMYMSLRTQIPPRYAN